jgi:putative membrane protein
MHNWGWGGGWNWGGGIFMGICGLLFIGLIVWIIMRASGHGYRHHGWAANQTPLDIAKERYAKGEITKEQFEQLKKDLI